MDTGTDCDNVSLGKATGASLCAHSWDSAADVEPRLTMEPAMSCPIEGSRADRALHDEDIVEVERSACRGGTHRGTVPADLPTFDASALFSGDTC